jgi:hypothetical protein
MREMIKTAVAVFTLMPALCGVPARAERTARAAQVRRLVAVLNASPDAGNLIETFFASKDYDNAKCSLGMKDYGIVAECDADLVRIVVGHNKIENLAFSQTRREYVIAEKGLLDQDFILDGSKLFDTKILRAASIPAGERLVKADVTSLLADAWSQFSRPIMRMAAGQKKSRESTAHEQWAQEKIDQMLHEDIP